ncbi:MAG: Mov34/MPN/PAD-1 family protein [Candidatus Hodarchaeota archaeon]
MPQLILSESLAEKIFTDVKHKAPEEACGVIGGEKEGEKYLVRAIYICRNEAENPYKEYFIAPEDLAKAFNDIETKNWEIIGFYHSHPLGEVKPSKTDYRQVTWYKKFYVITNLKKEIGAWLWDKEQDKFVEKKVIII